MEEAKENVLHFYPYAVALPSGVLWFASLSSLDKEFFEVRGYGLSIFLSLESSKILTGLQLLPASTLLQGISDFWPGIICLGGAKHHLNFNKRR